MRIATPFAAAAALAAGLLAVPPAGAQLFKCVQANGKVVYQDSRCDEAARQSTLRAPPPGPDTAKAAEPKSGAAPASAPAQAQPADNVIDLVAGFAVCAERVPNFSYKYTAAYEAWKSRNALRFSGLASEPAASKLDQSMRAERARPEGPGMAEHCAGVATQLQPPRAN